MTSAGLEGDPDLQFLLDGGELVKVRRGNWKKSRFFKLQEDCKTLWQESHKLIKRNQTCECHLLLGCLHVCVCILHFFVCMMHKKRSSIKYFSSSHCLLRCTSVSNYSVNSEFSFQFSTITYCKHTPLIPMLLPEYMEKINHLSYKLPSNAQYDLRL